MFSTGRGDTAHCFQTHREEDVGSGLIIEFIYT